MALRRGIAGCWVYTGRAEIIVVPSGHQAVCGRADGSDFVVDGMLRPTAWKSLCYAGELVVPEPRDEVQQHLPC